MYLGRFDEHFFDRPSILGFGIILGIGTERWCGDLRTDEDVREQLLEEALSLRFYDCEVNGLVGRELKMTSR